MLTQSEKAGESLETTVSRFAGTVSSFRPVQPLNAPSQIILTVSGRVNEVKVQFANAKAPIVVTVPGMLTDSRVMQL